MDLDGLDVETKATWIADGKGWCQMLGAASGVRVVGIHQPPMPSLEASVAPMK